jgi:hypothetical protein
MKNKNEILKSEPIKDLTRRKEKSRAYLRSLSPAEKIAKLVQLQEQYYQMLKIREKNGGSPIPERWQKWYQARFENSIN